MKGEKFKFVNTKEVRSELKSSRYYVERWRTNFQ